jgi:hypothetical protein
VARPEPELSGERGYGPLGVLEGPVGAAREAAEQALGIAGSFAASLAGRLGEAVGNVRRGGPGDDEDR